MANNDDFLDFSQWAVAPSQPSTEPEVPDFSKQAKPVAAPKIEAPKFDDAKEQDFELAWERDERLRKEAAPEDLGNVASAGPIDAKYIDAIKGFEGWTPKASWDVRQHSVGYGTRARAPGEVIDKAEGERRLNSELAYAAKLVDEFAPNLSPGKRAALTSLTFNAGSKWMGSGLGAAIRRGDWDEAARRFAQYTSPDPRYRDGLARRRQSELAWFGDQAEAPPETDNSLLKELMTASPDKRLEILERKIEDVVGGEIPEFAARRRARAENAASSLDFSQFAVEPGAGETSVPKQSDVVVGQQKQAATPGGFGDSQQYKEFLKGIAPGAVRMVGLGAKGAASLDPEQAVSSNAQRYMADIERVPQMTPAELSALRQRVEKEPAALTRTSVQSAISDLLDGSDTLEGVKARFSVTPVDQRTLYKFGHDVEEWSKTLFPAQKGYEDALGRQLGEGTGSVVGGLPFAFLGPAPAAMFFSAAGSGEAVDRAIEFDRKERAAGRPGLTQEQIAAAGVMGIAPGATDTLPIETLMGRLPIPVPPALREALARGVAKIGGKAFFEGLGRVAGQAAVEGSQEGLQSYLQDVISLTYDPNQKLGENILPEAGIGAGVGGIVQTAKEVGTGLVRAAAGRRGARSSEAEAPAEQEQNTEQINEEKKIAEERKLTEQRKLPPPLPEEGPAIVLPDKTVGVELLRREGWSDEDIADMGEEEFAAHVEDAKAQQPEGLADDEPTAEPVRDLTAQAADLRDPKNGRAAVWLPKASADALARDKKANKEVRGSGVVVEDFDGRGGVLVARDEQAAQDAVARRDAGVPIQTIVGEMTGSGTGKLPNADTVVQQVTKDGAVVRETAVPADQAEAAAEAFAAPDRDVWVGTLSEALARRDEAAAEDVKKVGSRAAPVAVETADDVTSASQRVTEPTPKQAESGNYRKGHVTLHGLDVTIETPKGGTRRGYDEEGNPTWEVPDMPAAYGYIKRSTGADGEQIDVYIGDNPQSDRVYLIDQVDAETGAFDEHKAVLGTNSLEEAGNLYSRAFSDGRGPDRVGGITEMSVSEFRDWVRSGAQKAPVSGGIAQQAEEEAGTLDFSDQAVVPAEPIGAQAPAKAKPEQIEPPRRYDGEPLSDMEIDAIVDSWRYVQETNRKKRPQSLTNFVIDNGGLVDDAREVRHIAGSAQERPGLISRNGQTLDDMALRAWQAGFMPGDRPTVAEFLDALDDDLMHGNIVREGDLAALEDFKYADEIAQELADYGVNTSRFRSEASLRDYFGQERKGAARPVEEGEEAQAAAEVGEGEAGSAAVEEAPYELAQKPEDFADYVKTGAKPSKSDAKAPEVSQSDNRLDGLSLDQLRQIATKVGTSWASAETAKQVKQRIMARVNARTDGADALRRAVDDVTAITTEASGQTSLVPPPTTKEEIDAASVKKGEKPEQKPMDEGLFGSDKDQLDLVDMAKKPAKTPGQTAYEEDVRRKPTYQDGGKRPSWDELDDTKKATWEKNPTARGGAKPEKSRAGWQEAFRDPDLVHKLDEDGETIGAVMFDRQRQKKDHDKGWAALDADGNVLGYAPTLGAAKEIVDAQEKAPASADQAERDTDTGPEGEAYTSLEDLKAAVASGKVKSVPGNEHLCYKIAGQKALDGGHDLVIGKANGTPHGIARTTDGVWTYEPQFDIWLDSDVHDEAVGGFVDRHILSSDEVKEFVERTGMWPSMEQIAEHGAPGFDPNEELVASDTFQDRLLANLEAASAREDLPHPEIVDYMLAEKLIGKTKTGYRLLAAGKSAMERQHEAAREEAEYQAKLADLPDDIDALTEHFIDRADAYNEAMLAGDQKAVDRVMDELDLALEKANGGTRFGVGTPDSPAQILRDAVTVKPGQAPHWGQIGSVEVEFDGVKAIVTKDGVHDGFGDSLHAVEFNRPFPSSTGYRSTVGRAMRGGTPAIGKTYAAFAHDLLAATIEDEKTLVLPEGVYVAVERDEDGYRHVQHIYRGREVTRDTLPKAFPLPKVEAVIERWSTSYTKKNAAVRSRIHPNHLILVNEGGEMKSVQEFPTSGAYLTYQTGYRPGGMFRYVADGASIDKTNSKDKSALNPDGRPVWMSEEEIDEASATEALTNTVVGPEPTEAVAPSSGNENALRDRIIGEGFKDIREARKFARANGFAEATDKEIDEAIEVAVVAAAKVNTLEYSAQRTEREMYRRMVQLYDNQPNLGVRTGTSMANQAYSTPMPLAYLAARLAGTRGADVVYEPTAGNGALLIDVIAPGKVFANELDTQRAAALKAQGYRTTALDATDPAQAKAIRQTQDGADSVIMNPPFGAVREDGRSKSWQIDDFKTTTVDHAIALTALEAMHDRGKAVLILGGINATDVDERRKGYRGQAKRQFFARLYRDYNVVDHFTVSGDLYRKQGAGWPVDVVVIDGRGQSLHPLPAAKPPAIFDSWDALEGKLPNADAQANEGAAREDRRPNAGPDRAESKPVRDNADGGEKAGRGRTGGRDADVKDEPDAVRGNRDRGQPGDVRPGEGTARDDTIGTSGKRGRADRPAPAPRRERVAPPEGSGQALYEPTSEATSLDALVPSNMAHATKSALSRIAKKNGGVDKFVASALDYDVDELSDYFSAEQVDAIAAAIDNIGNGDGFIIGDQCVAGHTRIYDPETGTFTAIKVLAERKKPIRVLALTPKGFVVASATAPFRKGEADLYRVVLDDGREITVTRQHRFLTPDGWRTLDDGLRAGHSLASAEGHLLNNLGERPSIHHADDPRSIGTVQGYLDGCSAYPYRDDAQLHAVQGGAQGSVPSPADVLEHIRCCSLLGEWALSRGHSHRYQDTAHRSRSGSSPWVSRALSPSDSQDDASRASMSLSIPRNAPLSRGAQELLDREGAAILADLSLADASGLSVIANGAQRCPCAGGRAPFEREQKAQPQSVARSGHPDTSSKSGLCGLSFGDHTGWRRIVSITHVGRDEFFDMWVPGFENYMAEGLVNHNTGIGKGRVVAAMIRYATIKGWTPVFVTEKPDLYGDMFRDMADIGLNERLGREPRVFMTNTAASVPLDEKALEWKNEYDEWSMARDEVADRLFGEKYSKLKTKEQREAVKAEFDKPKPKQAGRFLKTGTNEKQLDEMTAIVNGTANYDAVFTTYDQMNNPAKAPESQRRRFLRQVIPNSLLILDESHNAGGQGDKGWRSNDATDDRATFVRDMVQQAKGVMYSSATFAKRPDVMDLYARTDMGKAVDDPKKLPELIQRGGVPMQQIVATMLSDAGQYMRRERSFEGVEYSIDGVPVEKDAYKQFTSSVRSIFEFDKAVEEMRGEFMQDVLDGMGATVSNDAGVGEATAHSTNFSSIMHNVINQMLLSITSDQVADKAIESYKNGEKPIIALSNTMESFVGDYAEELGLKPGDTIDISFGDVLRRYLARTLRITVNDADGNRSHIQIPIKALPSSLKKMYDEAERLINDGVYTLMPVSPIDWVRHRLGKAGISVAEVTGRSLMIDYSGNAPTLVDRPKNEAGPAGKRSSISKYNNGRLDALILNRSGSTGVSMHASEKFKDQRRRRMIIQQADPNVDVHLQMLGRVHRTGQVIPPVYSQIAAEIPASARPTAVLMKKMASLNANTTGARGSVFMADAVDFMNEVGDKIVANIIMDDWEIGAALGNPLKENDKGIPMNEDAARRVTGRLVLLEPEQQAALLDRIQSEYTAEIERLDAMGENTLEAKTVDLQAKVLDEVVLRDKQGEGPFLDASYMQKVSVKAQGRAMAPEEIADKIAKAIDVSVPAGGVSSALQQLEQQGRTAMNAKVTDINKRVREWIASEVAKASDETKVSTRDRHNKTLSRWNDLTRIVAPGARVVLDMKQGQMSGIVLSVERTGKTKNLSALGAWQVVVAVPDSVRTITFPMSKLFTDANPKGEEESGATIAPSRVPLSGILSQMEDARREGREERYIVTGNILAGYEQVMGRGRIINFTMEDGTLRPGILMGRDFVLDKFMEKRAIRFKSADQIVTFMTRAPNAQVRSTDRFITLSRPAGAWQIDMPSGRATGGRYFTDKRVLEAIKPHDFRRVAGIMTLRLYDVGTFKAAVEEMRRIGALFETTEDQEVAQEVARQGLPQTQSKTPEAPSEAQQVASRTINEFRRDVDALKERSGIETRKRSFGSDSEPLSAATGLAVAMDMKKTVAEVKSGSRLNAMAKLIAQFGADATDASAMIDKAASVDVEAASLDDLRTFVSAMDDLVQVMEARAQDGWQMIDDVEDLGTEFEEALEKLGERFDEISTAAQDQIYDLELLEGEISERYDDLAEERFGGDEDALEAWADAQYEANRTDRLPTIIDESHYPGEQETLGEVLSREVALGERVLARWDEAAKGVLARIDPEKIETLEQADAALSVVSPVLSQLRSVAEWMDKHWDFAQSGVKRIGEAIEAMRDEQLRPAVDKMEENQGRIQEIYDAADTELFDRETNSAATATKRPMSAALSQVRAGGAVDQFDAIQQAIAAGQSYDVPFWHVQDQMEAIRPNLHMFPAGTVVGVLHKISPRSNATGKPEDQVVTLHIRTPDGKNKTMSYYLQKLPQSRALAFPRGFLGDRPGYFAINLVIGKQTADAVSGGVWHEAFHILRREGLIGGDRWARLLRHAKKLRVFDMAFKDVLEKIKDPTTEWCPEKVTLRQVYSRLYEGRSDRVEVMHQEEITHMIELWHHGALTDADVAPVLDILNDIGSGKIAGNQSASSRDMDRILFGEGYFAAQQAPSDQDELGYYSALLRAAHNLKQEKGTPEQMLSMLTEGGKKNTKEAEAIGLDRLFDGKKRITKSEIIAFIDENRVQVLETRTGAPKLQPGYRIVSREDLAIERGERYPENVYRDLYTVPYYLVDQDGYTVAGDRSRVRLMRVGAQRTRFERYSLDQDNDTYDEVVVHMPKVEATRADIDKVISERFRDGITWDDLNQHDRELVAGAAQDDVDAKSNVSIGHFRQVNQIGHLMTSQVRLTPEDQAAFPPDRAGTDAIVYDLDQIQSDRGQAIRKARKGDAPDGLDALRYAILETQLEDVERVWNSLQKPVGTYDDMSTVLESGLLQDYGEGMPDGNEIAEALGVDFEQVPFGFDRPLKRDAVEIAKTALRAKDGADPEQTYGYIDQEDYVRYWANERDRLLGEFSAMHQARRSGEKAKRLSHPLVDTTDQWTTTMLRRALRLAIDSNADYISIPSGDTVLSYNPGKEDGMRKFYGARPPHANLVYERNQALQDMQNRHIELYRKIRDPNYKGDKQILQYEVDELGPQMTAAKNALDDLAYRSTEFVEGIVPMNLRKILEKLDKKAARPFYVEQMVTPTQGPKGNGFTVFRITDKVRQRVKAEGQPLFAVNANAIGQDIKSIGQWIEWAENLGDKQIPIKDRNGKPFTIDRQARYGSITYTVKDGRKTVGRFYVRTGGTVPGSISVMNAMVEDNYQRRGIASAVYDAIEADTKAGGRPLYPQGRWSLSPDGRAFWQARDPAKLAEMDRLEDAPGYAYGQSIRVALDRPAQDRLKSRIQDAIRIVRRIAGPDVHLDFKSQIPARAARQGVEDMGAFRDAGLVKDFIGGFYRPETAYLEALIGLSVEAPGFDLRTAAGHEAWHHVERVFATDAELRVLYSRAEQGRMTKLAAQELGLDPENARDAQLLAAMPPVEITAYAFQRYRRLREEGMGSIGGLHIAVRRLFDRLQAIFKSIRAVVKGEGLTYEKIFETARSGAMAKRAPRVAQGQGRVAASSVNSLDMSPEARKARAKAMGFDTSKVWYHGAPRWERADGSSLGDIFAFERRASVDRVRRAEGMDTVGIWFSNEGGRDGASMYAGQDGAVYPVYLRVMNPWRPKSFDEFLDKMHETAGRDPKTQKPRGIGSTDALRAWLYENNFDGIMFPAGAVDGDSQIVMVALEPEQVRSVNAAFDESLSDVPALLAQSLPRIEDIIQSVVEKAANTNDSIATHAALFVDQYLTFEDGQTTMSGEMYDAYKIWAKNAGVEAGDEQAFHRALISNGGLSRMKIAGRMRYIGVRIASKLGRKVADANALMPVEKRTLAQDIAQGVSFSDALTRLIESVKSRFSGASEDAGKVVADVNRLRHVQDQIASSNDNDSDRTVADNVFSMFDSPDILAMAVPGGPPARPMSWLERRVRRTFDRVAERSDAIRVRMQDKALPIKRLAVERVEAETATEVPVSLDTYLKEALYSGRAGERMVDLEQDYIEPLVEFMRDEGISLEGLGDYLYARHARERNDWIALINPDMPDGGSGMTNAEADQILADVRASGKQRAMDEAARRIDKMIEKSRKDLLKAGLIDRETFDNWSQKYAAYVPLRGFDIGEDENPDFPRVGRGFDVRGREAFQALGRRSKADNPVIYAVQQAQQAIVRAEKNRVNKTLYNAVKAYPNDSFWKVYNGEVRRRFNPSTGLVEEYWVPPQFVRRDDVIGVKLNGKQKWVELKHPDLARAMRGVGSDVAGSAIGRAAHKVMRTYAGLLTSYNPEFVVSNFFRDVQTAVINATGLEDKPVGLRRQIAKDAVSTAAIRGALAAIRGTNARTASSQKYARYYEEFRLAGGKVSFIEFNDVERIRNKTLSALKAGRVRRGLRAAMESVENLNTAVENGVRLSTYSALRDAGMSQDQAAFIAKELTVNFNRKGEWGPGINALYLFFNASVQGITRMARAIATSSKVRYALGGLLAFGAMLDLLNYLAAGDDDDGENRYDKIPHWVKERNLIVMNPLGDGNYLMIPLPYGYNTPFLAGQEAMSVIRGVSKPEEAAGRVLLATLEAFNPMGSAGSFLQYASPTLLDPAVQIMENRNWFGGRISPKKFDEREPDSQLYFDSAPVWAKEVARILNEKSGGNIGRPGWADFSPETIEHWAEFAGGGTAKFFFNSIATAERFVDGEEWLPEKTPLVRRVYGRQDSVVSRKREFYDAWADVDQAHYEVKALAKDGDREALKAARETYAPELRAYNAMKGARKQLKSLREAKTALEARTDLDAATKRQRLDDIAAKEKQVVMRSLKVYEDAKKQK